MPFGGRNHNRIEQAQDLLGHQPSGRQFRAEMMP
jgi:hypothetical protein